MAFGDFLADVFDRRDDGPPRVDVMAHGIDLDPAGADIVSLRTGRGSITHLFFYQGGRLLTACVGNQDPNDGGPDYRTGTRGPFDGDYFLLPKPERDYENKKFEYLAGTPSVTGKGFPVGQPGDGFRNTIRFHPCGDSIGCQTAPLRWANLVWDLMENVPARRLHLRLRTVERPDPVPDFPTPRSRSHPWPAFNGDSKEPIP